MAVVAVAAVFVALLMWPCYVVMWNNYYSASHNHDHSAARQHDAARQPFLAREFPAGNAAVHHFRLRHSSINVTVVHVAPLMRHPPPQSPPPPVLFVHGIGSSATMILASPEARSLRATHDLYAVDVPGLVGAGPDADRVIAAMSADEYLAMFAAVLDRLLLVHLPAPPIIIAHSLGAFLVSETIGAGTTAAENVVGMVMMSPAGVVDNLGVLGQFWTLFFRAGLPTSLLRPLARAFIWLDDNSGLLLRSRCKNPLIQDFEARQADRGYHWMHLQAAAPRANVAAKFIVGRLPFAVWSHPQLDHLVRGIVPTIIIWGEEDALAPMNSDEMMQRVGGSVVATHVLPGVGHSVLHHSSAVLILAVGQLCTYMS